MMTLNHSCPFCEAHLNRTESLFDPNDRPEPGDTSLCLSCGRWCIFEDDLSLRRPTRSELIEIAEDPACRAAVMGWLAV